MSNEYAAARDTRPEAAEKASPKGIATEGLAATLSRPTKRMEFARIGVTARKAESELGGNRDLRGV